MSDTKWMVYNHYREYEDTVIFDTKEEAENYRNEWLEIVTTGMDAGTSNQIKQSQFKIYRCLIDKVHHD